MKLFMQTVSLRELVSLHICCLLKGELEELRTKAMVASLMLTRRALAVARFVTLSRTASCARPRGEREVTSLALGAVDVDARLEVVGSRSRGLPWAHCGGESWSMGAADVAVG